MLKNVYEMTPDEFLDAYGPEIETMLLSISGNVDSPTVKVATLVHNSLVTIHARSVLGAMFGVMPVLDYTHMIIVAYFMGKLSERHGWELSVEGDKPNAAV